VIDTLPGTPQVIVASPCSGHGFKFASVVGEVLADMASNVKPRLDLRLFAISRPELQPVGGAKAAPVPAE
jgi:sarcosine oxidase